MKKLLCILLSSIIVFTPLIFVFSNAAETEEICNAEEFVNGIQSLMIESSDGISEYSKSALSKNEEEYSDFSSCRLIVKSKNKIDTQGASAVINGYNDLWILKYNSSKETAEAYEYYQTNDKIEYVEADRPIYALSEEETVEVTEKVYESWGPKYIGLDAYNNNIKENKSKLEEVVVAVLDTGTDSTHTAFNGRVVPTNVNTSTTGNRNDSSDDNGHGTQVAGVIIDSTLDNVTVRPYKVLDKWGQGTLISLAAGIICAVNDGVDIINMSIAFSESSETLKEAVQLAGRNNIVLIAASGNDSSNTVYYPASYDCVIKVGAINDSGVIANFSTGGDDMDFAAPGVNITTTNIGNKYKTVSGTSFAAPLVAALAAAMLTSKPRVSPVDIYEVMAENAISVQYNDAKTKYGNGIINAPEYSDESNHIEKTQSPYFSHQTAILKEEIDLEIFCDTPNSTIYYTTDRTVPSKTNPTSVIYDGKPIHLSQTSVITAVAYCEGKFCSSVVNFASIIVPVLPEEFFEIDSSGIITAYTGTQSSFTVPDSINGITVTGIGNNAFANTDISEIVFPLTVTSIGTSAFEECNSLITVSAKNATSIGDRAFYNCNWLKNIYINQAQTIGQYAFYNVCSQPYQLSGTTFTLDFESTTTISQFAFQNSAISNVELIDARSIGKSAFLDCPALINIKTEKLSMISNEAFKNCTSLTDVELGGLSSVAVGTFSGCTSLTHISLPNVSSVLARAFENCIALETIKLPNATTVYSSAFTGCTALRIIVVPKMTSFESAVYKAETTTYPQFSAALEAFIAPNLEKTSAYMFGSAPNILSVSFKDLTSVADYTFSGCTKMMYLNIQSVTDLSELALADSKIDFIDARNLKTAAAFPDNSGIMLSNNFTSAASAASSLTVYGSSGSNAEAFANYNGYKFCQIPYVYSEIPKYITEICGSVTIKAVGFDLTYQWYSNKVNSNEGGTPIEGATSETYTFTKSDTAYYYYCVVTQNDFGAVSKYTTDTIIKDPKPADYTFYNIAVKEANKLNPEYYTNFEIVTQALSVDVSGKRSCEQKEVDIQTAAIRAAILKLKYNKVTSASLTANNTMLSILEKTTVKVITHPNNSVYKKIEWSSDNPDAFVVSKRGVVRCIGNGKANIDAVITNHDGSVIFTRIQFESMASSWFSKLIASLFKVLFVWMP